MRITKFTCDCGCGQEVGSSGFELSQGNFTKLNNLGRGVVMLGRELHFVDLNHLGKILPRILEVSAGLKKAVEDAVAAGARGTPYSVILAKKDGSKTIINGAETLTQVKVKIDALLK